MDRTLAKQRAASDAGRLFYVLTSPERRNQLASTPRFLSHLAGFVLLVQRSHAFDCCQASCPCPGRHWHRGHLTWTCRCRSDWLSWNFRPSAMCRAWQSLPPDRPWSIRGHSGRHCLSQGEPVCANASVLESANTPASAIDESFMIGFLIQSLITKQTAAVLDVPAASQAPEAADPTLDTDRNGTSTSHTRWIDSAGGRSNFRAQCRARER